MPRRRSRFRSAATGCFCRRVTASARRCWQIAHGADGQFAAAPLWDPPIKRVMKTKFANVVVRDGYVYGLDDVLLSCIELETGQGRTGRSAAIPSSATGRSCSSAT